MTRQPRLPILIALTCALFLRVMIPAGWMPAPERGAFAIQPCPAAEPAPAAHSMHHGGAHHDPSRHAQHEGDCAFSPLLAGFGPAADVAQLPVPVVQAASAAAVPAPVYFATGPPAPPPPARGPPAFA